MEQFIDRNLMIARKRRAALAGGDPADFLTIRAAAELGDRIALVERRFDEAVTLFEGSGHAAEALMASGKVGRVRRIEADPVLLGDAEGLVEMCEVVPLPAGSIDLAVSLLSLHAINDLPGLLAQIRRALRPDGLFIAAMFGAGTLSELRDSLLHAEVATASGASPRVYPFAEIRQAGALLQRAGFALPVADLESVTVRYASMISLLADLRGMGETSALAERSRRPLSRQTLAAAAEHYARNHSAPDGRLTATFNLVWLSGWAPDASQPKPKQPGSATVSLAEALKKLEK